MHAVTQFHFCTVTANAESVGPGVRVTWSTSVPLGGIKSVRVEFRKGIVVVATNTTTNASQTEFIQTGLQCATHYQIRVIVTGEINSSVTANLSVPSDVHLRFGGKGIVCMHEIMI